MFRKVKVCPVVTQLSKKQSLDSSPICLNPNPMPILHTILQAMDLPVSPCGSHLIKIT